MSTRGQQLTCAQRQKNASACSADLAATALPAAVWPAAALRATAAPIVARLRASFDTGAAGDEVVTDGGGGVDCDAEGLDCRGVSEAGARAGGRPPLLLLLLFVLLSL